MVYADVILPLPLPHLYTYAVPEAIQTTVRVGSRVIVPFGAKKTYTAVVARLHGDAPQGITVKSVLETLDEHPSVLPEQLKFWHWIADYYLCAPGDVMKAAMPAGMKRAFKPRPLQTADKLPIAELPVLSPAQETALSQINVAFDERAICLLHGVTASGKTEIYIHLMQQATEQGKQVLFLVPEIALTTQLTERLFRVFGERIGVYHSKFSDAKRVEIWRQQLSENPYEIIVGVRSSLFLPFQQLGLVIIDEEHEASYKQNEPAPRYHARDAAVMLAHFLGARTLLGTATPAVETYYNALSHKYGLVRLTERYGDAQLPEIEVVNTRELRRKRMMNGPFSPRLVEAMRDALEKQEQIILFQNRRGYAPALACRTCGWTPRCPRCDVSLTWHKSLNAMTCHYCGFTCPVPSKCPACDETDFIQYGFGTEKIEDIVHNILPRAVAVRLDLDSARSRKAYESILAGFEHDEINILIGTQMVTKGLDFEHVGLVGILDADAMLSYPDFRSYERAFQLMSQVAGRAGRRKQRGLVILQTKSPDLPLIDYVSRHDYAAFYDAQLKEREAFRFPPFCRLTYVYLKHKNSATLDRLAAAAADSLRALLGDCVLGPDAPPVARVQTYYIRKIMIKIEHGISPTKVRTLLLRLRQQLLAQTPFRSARIFFDADPL